MFIDFIPLHKLFKFCVIVSLCGVAADICIVIIMSGVTMWIFIPGDAVQSTMDRAYYSDLHIPWLEKGGGYGWA